MNLEISTNTENLSHGIFNISQIDFDQTNNNAPQAFITTENDLSISSEIYLSTENEDTANLSTEIPLNVINLRDNQIVKIEYQNAAGIINTEYIMNNQILTPQFLDSINSTSQIISDITLDNNDIQIIDKSNFEETVVDSPNIQSEEQTEDLIKFNETPKSQDDLIKFNDSGINSLPSPETDEEMPCETDLTSLNWLHNITNIMAVPNIPTPPISPPPTTKKNNKNVGNCQEDLTININFYKKNGDKKPPFSYATLICMAMSKNGNKMTLSAIYNWIRENFLYYRKAHPSWQVIYSDGKRDVKA